MGIVFTSLLTVLCSCIVYLAEKYTRFSKINNKYKQLIIGTLFGIITCLCTEYGVKVDGAVVNVRDAAPLCAGLLFGGPSGILAGLIGGIYRLFWGASLASTFTSAWISGMFSVDAVGGFTRVACTLGTILSGFFGAYMRKFMFENKRPSWFYGFAVGLTTEVLHLFLVFIFRLNYLERVYDVICSCTLPMITANALSVTLSVVVVRLLSGEKRNKGAKVHDLSKSFQYWLFLVVIISFVTTTFCMSLIQQKLGIKQAEILLKKNMNDLIEKIDLDGGIDNFVDSDFTWHVGTEGGIIIAEYIPDEDGNTRYLDILLNGEEYNKGERISIESISNGHVRKMSDNFFFSTIHINNTDTPVYGMYEPYGADKVIITYVPTHEAMLFQGVTVYLTIFFEILVFAALFVHIYYLIKKLVVHNLNKVNKTLAEITGGNLDAVVNVRSHSEFVYLSDDINQTVATLKMYIAEAASRIDKELEFARTIQHSSLPSVFPPYPNRTDFDIYASMYTAKEVGGDFYDFYMIGENKLAFLVADVSGKGIPAAMFMMTSKTTIKGLAETGMPIDEVFTVANEKLCDNNEAGMFVTAFMGVIDLDTGLVTVVNAGHNPPLVKRSDGKFEYFKVKAGFILAGMEGIKYKTSELKLEPGDTIYLYTDGVTEATSAETELFGEERLKAVLDESDGLDMKGICDMVKESIDLFVGDAEQFDDITMLALKYKGGQIK